VCFRLEKEEKERLEAAKLERLGEMKRKIEDEKQRIRDAGGVVYKGMSYFPLVHLSMSTTDN